MSHAFLLNPGTWGASGKFYDENGIAQMATGTANIVHERLLWRNDGTMTIHSATPVTFHSSYEIQPFQRDSDTTKWKANNPALGVFFGMFSYTDEIITSLYHTEDRKITGHEVLIRIDDSHYRAAGTLYDGEKKVSSWDIVLTRKS